MKAKLGKALSKAANTWPFWAQVAGSLVACFALGMILGGAYGLLASGLAAVGFGMANEGDA
jgi:hypothetical protein